MKYTILLFSLLLLGCATEPATADDKQEEVLPSWVKVFASTIGDMPVMVRLTHDGGGLEGQYHYTNAGSGELRLKGVLAAQGFNMVEFDSEGRQSGEFDGEWSAGKLVGFWSRPDGSGKTDFQLIETGQRYEADPPPAPPRQSAAEMELIQRQSQAEGQRNRDIIMAERAGKEVYTRSSDGLLIMSYDETRNEVSFSLSTLGLGLGTDDCSREVAGVVERISTGFEYESRNCLLTFRMTNGLVKVEAKLDCSDTGSACDFSGTYERPVMPTVTFN